MAPQIITEQYYGHTLEVTINETNPPELKVEFVPDSVHEHVFRLLETDDKAGDFTHDETKEIFIKQEVSYSGSWRIIELDYNILIRLVMWNANRYPEESITKQLFIEYFGDNYGTHFYGKWTGECNHDILKMIGYFRSNHNHGQIFCNMLFNLITKYEKRDR